MCCSVYQVRCQAVEPFGSSRFLRRKTRLGQCQTPAAWWGQLASAGRRASWCVPLTEIARAILASLLANAQATTLEWRRASMAVIHSLMASVCESVRSIMARAHWTSNRRRFRSPRLLSFVARTHEPHAGSTGGFADRLGIPKVTLVARHERLDESWQDQSGVVSHAGQSAYQPVRAGTGFHDNTAGRDIRQRPEQLLAG